MLFIRQLNKLRSSFGFLKYSSKNLFNIFSVAVVLVIPVSSQNLSRRSYVSVASLMFRLRQSFFALGISNLLSRCIS